ncbi:MAG TPA: hypothetical protein PKE31_18390 [Pseudomonadota bacterium]|nr:hypothetical protein [Pseudomonadota bacterium]HMU40983.1 hypothetical protein [Pseudomonadota bacterium]
MASVLCSLVVFDRLRTAFWRSALLVSVGATFLGNAQRLRAGGFEIPANGTEALGRGGAFSAKADSPLALEYNVGGLAQQRGTHALFDNNVAFSRYRFAREGGDSFGAFPTVQSDATPPFYAPWFGLTTDFGFFKRITFAAGVYGPSSIGRRTFPVFVPTDDGKQRPGPGRYDLATTDLLIFYPTIAVGVRAARFLDLGFAVQQVSAQIKLSSMTYAPQSLPMFPSSSACTTQTEAAGCDSVTRFVGKSYDNYMLQLGALFHVGRAVDVGVNVRSASNLGVRPILVKGTVSATEPPFLQGMGIGAEKMDGEFSIFLPWVFRGGIRFGQKLEGQQLFDIEADVVYEAWSWLSGTDHTLVLKNPPPLVNKGQPVEITLPHHYRDTLGLRLGGSLFMPFSADAGVTMRVGGFYDGSASADADLRLDFDTLAKLGATGGLGFLVRGVEINVAYAYQHSLSRTVTDGRLFAIDGTTGQPVQIGGKLAPAVNNGTYSGSTHLVSAGLTMRFEEWRREPTAKPK